MKKIKTIMISILLSMSLLLAGCAVLAVDEPITINKPHFLAGADSFISNVLETAYERINAKIEKQEAINQNAKRAERKARFEADREAFNIFYEEYIARKEAEKAEAERLEAERLEVERIAAEKAEAERLAQEEAKRLEAERLAAEKAEAERLAQEAKKAQEEKEKQSAQNAPSDDNSKNNNSTPPPAPESNEKKVSLKSLVKDINNVPDKYLEIVGTLLEAIKDGSDGNIQFEFANEDWVELVETAVEYVLPYTHVNLNIGYATIGHYNGNTKTEKYYIAVISKEKLRDCYNKEIAVEGYVKSAAAVVKAGMTEREAYKAIHDYVCAYLNYDFSYSVRSIQEAFIKKVGVCEAYARMTKAICDYVGIECEYVTGYADNSNGWGYHAWNRVKINGTWYWSDVCWDGSFDKTVYTYYLSEALWDNHKLD